MGCRLKFAWNEILLRCLKQERLAVLAEEVNWAVYTIDIFGRRNKDAHGAVNHEYSNISITVNVPYWHSKSLTREYCFSQRVDETIVMRNCPMSNILHLTYFLQLQNQ